MTGGLAFSFLLLPRYSVFKDREVIRRDQFPVGLRDGFGAIPAKGRPFTAASGEGQHVSVFFSDCFANPVARPVSG